MRSLAVAVGETPSLVESQGFSHASLHGLLMTLLCPKLASQNLSGMFQSGFINIKWPQKGIQSGQSNSDKSQKNSCLSTLIQKWDSCVARNSPTNWSRKLTWGVSSYPVISQLSVDFHSRTSWLIQSSTYIYIYSMHQAHFFKLLYHMHLNTHTYT